MPYLQPATANYFGFQPVENTAGTRINAYGVSSSEGAIYLGDMCILTSINTVKSMSTGSAAGGTNVVGVSAQYFAANAGSTTLTNTNKCLIYDAPDQLFYGADTSSGAVGSSGIGLSYFIRTTGCLGSTGPHGTLNRSVMVISGAVQASSAGNVTIMALHPVENNVFATGTTGIANVRKWIFRIRAHTHQVGQQVDLLTT